MQTKMQKRVQKNYPVANNLVQDRFKAQALKRINNFKPGYLVTKDERWAKYSKPLSGYVTEKDHAKLDRIGEIFVKPLTKQQVQNRIKKLKEKMRAEEEIER